MAPAPVGGLLPPPIASFGRQRSVVIPRWLLLLLLVLGQVLLARVMPEVPRVSQVHALALVMAIMFALAKRNTPMLLMTLAYVPGAEIMWRQSHANLPSGMAPYLMTMAGIVALTISYPQLTRAGRAALLYLGLLLPSTVVTLSTTGTAARELVTFVLAGPMTLTALVLLFSQLTITTDLFRKILWAIVLSGVGPLVIALSSISDYIGAGNTLEFNDQSNSITSGGFGPVQVSSLLGFTVLAAILLFTVERQLVPRITVFVIGIASMTQSLLTFSRGGMFATAIALGGLVISQATNRRTRGRTFAAVGVLLAVGYFVIVPRIDTFTQGKFQERFGTTHTGRTTLATSDLDLFRKHIWFGVGPGMAKFRQISFEICQLRSDKCKNEGASHTEFTRMPAEHGLAGVVAIGVMIAMGLEALRRAGPSFGVSVAMLLWAVAQMFYANLRVSAVPFAFAFAFLRIRAPAPDPSAPEAAGTDQRRAPPLAVAI